MPQEPKLELYILRLNVKKSLEKKVFRDFYRTLSGYSSLGSNKTQEDIFKVFYQDFVSKITQEKYQKSKTKNKGFTILVQTVDNISKTSLSSPSNANEIISGVLKGGPFGRQSDIGLLSDTSKAAPINTDNIINDQFYFLLYTPFDHSAGVLMVQGYSELKISDVFREHLLDYFTYGKSIESEVEYFVPKSFKDEFLKDATLKSFKFTTGLIIRGGFEDDIPDNYKCEIKVEIIDKNANIEQNSWKKIIASFGQTLLRISENNQTKLEDFPKKTARITGNSGRNLPVKIDDDYDVRPVILLSEIGIQNDETGRPDFIALDTYCRTLLEDIKQEILPTNAIKEL